MKKIISICILCISTKSFSQLVSSARIENAPIIKTNDINAYTVKGIEKNEVVLNSMGRFVQPIIVSKLDTIKENKVIAEKRQPQLLSTKRRQE